MCVSRSTVKRQVVCVCVCVCVKSRSDGSMVISHHHHIIWLTLIALLFETTLGATVGHFDSALASTGVSAAGARFDVLVAAFDLAGLLVMILTGTSAAATRLGPHIHFTCFGLFDFLLKKNENQLAIMIYFMSAHNKQPTSPTPCHRSWHWLAPGKTPEPSFFRSQSVHNCWKRYLTG